LDLVGFIDGRLSHAQEAVSSGSRIRMRHNDH
jgi:hypothetical protein